MPGVDKTAPATRTRLTAEQRRESVLDAATEVISRGLITKPAMPGHPAAGAKPGPLALPFNDGAC